MLYEVITEQLEVSRIDQRRSDDVSSLEGEPVGPEAARRVLEQHDRTRRGLARLHQGQDLEGFVVGSEAARKQADRVALLHEHELAREEVLEADLLRIAVEDRTRSLFVV